VRAVHRARPEPLVYAWAVEPAVLDVVRLVAERYAVQDQAVNQCSIAVDQVIDELARAACTRSNGFV
jgi:hypothetical protein